MPAAAPAQVEGDGPASGQAGSEAEEAARGNGDGGEWEATAGSSADFADDDELKDASGSRCATSASLADTAGAGQQHPARPRGPFAEYFKDDPIVLAWWQSLCGGGCADVPAAGAASSSDHAALPVDEAAPAPPQDGAPLQGVDRGHAQDEEEDCDLSVLMQRSFGLALSRASGGPGAGTCDHGLAAPRCLPVPGHVPPNGCAPAGQDAGRPTRRGRPVGLDHRTQS